MTPFSFGFDSEDIEADAAGDDTTDNEGTLKHAEQELQLVEPQLHTLDEMLLHLPSSITYTTHQIPPSRQDTRPLCLPRRELFDIRAQAMAEEDIHDPHRFPSPGLISDDIISRVYEGGFKTWECAVDLARYLSKSIVDGHLALRGRDVHVIELGAGTAVPTSCLLFHVMQPQPPSNTRPRIRITVADYNTQVLALATIPNLLLTITSLRPPPPPWLEEGDFEPFAAQLADFRASLDAAGVRISAISGAWGPEFVRLLRSAALDDVGEDGGAAEGRVTLVLASETIYAPASLRPFAETLLALLRLGSSRAVDRAVALVAAKRVYFGVGGGVDEFLAVLGELGGEARCVWSSGEEEGRGQGVGRCILEVGLRVGG